MGSEPAITIETRTEHRLTPKELSRRIGDEMILNGDGGPFAYLAGLSFDGMGSDSDAVDILVEYLENENSFDFDDGEVGEIESTLRDAYDE